jgi:hypothetical protein
MKRQLGQFFTTNSKYIFQGFENFVRDKEIFDPFAGNQDILNWSKKNGCKNAIGFDIDKKFVDNKIVFHNDSINNPRKYIFVCANPPYLHKNKADKKTKEKFFLKDNSIFEDLYQISIKSILNSEEGILIVPLNFLSAENSKRIRNIFFDKFRIVKMNIFLEKVFEDTTYNVISFYYRKNKRKIIRNKIQTNIFPQNEKIDFVIEKKFDWQLGGNFIKRIKETENLLKVFRFTRNHIVHGNCKTKIAIQDFKNKEIFSVSENLRKILNKNILLLRAIDNKNGKKIQLEDIRKYGINGLAGKESSRNMAHLIFNENISLREQEELIEDFNKILNEKRKKYSSFFLTNFRDNNRKRISFDFAYKLLNYLYYEKNKKQPILF